MGYGHGGGCGGPMGGHGYDPGWDEGPRGGAPWSGAGPDRGGGPGWGRQGGRMWRGGLALALRRLQATPDQERVIREQLEQLRESMQSHREEWSTSRRDVAQAIRNESFDETTMGELFGRHDERLTEVRKAVMEALGHIHAVLDETQRERLAQMLDRGAGSWHPFRGGMA
ncbi:MAG: Spy/CpxP family protein refolding chaperone [Deltaproteobacteria bacterium]|nr:Spy/CpxP family protein refolding chaperone [Deltaproteobacteria bacterium]